MTSDADAVAFDQLLDKATTVEVRGQRVQIYPLNLNQVGNLFTGSFVLWQAMRDGEDLFAAFQRAERGTIEQAVAYAVGTDAATVRKKRLAFHEEWTIINAALELSWPEDDETLGKLVAHSARFANKAMVSALGPASSNTSSQPDTETR